MSNRDDLTDLNTTWEADNTHIDSGIQSDLHAAGDFDAASKQTDEIRTKPDLISDHEIHSASDHSAHDADENDIGLNGEEDELSGQDKRLRIPIPVILFLLAVLALDVISMIRFPNILKDYKIYQTAEGRISNGETSKALNDLLVLTEQHPDSVPIIIKTIELSMEYGYYDNAGYVYDTYLVGKNLTEEEYNRVDRYTEKLENYYATSEEISMIFDPILGSDLTTGEPDYEAIRTRLKALLDKEGQDRAVIYYYLAMVEADIEAAIDYLKKCYDTDPECFDVRVQLGLMYRRTGDYETARQYAEKALIKDKQDFGALRSIAILDMLEGNMERGLENAEAAYRSYPDGIFVRETYMIALFFNDKKSEAEVIKGEIIKAQGALDPDTAKLLGGKISLKDYYVNSEG